MNKVIFINDGRGVRVMVRDKLRNKQYFETYIESEDASVTLS